MRGVAVQLAVEPRSCIRARRVLSLALDGEAGASDVLSVAAHLAGCERCHRFATQLVVITRELRSVREPRDHHEERV